MTRPLLSLLLSGLLLLVGAAASATQPYPARPITLIVPFAAGGPSDMVARIVSEHMSKTLGRPIVVENAAGGGGLSATARVVRAPPDGYTIELGNMGTHAAAVALYPRLGYHPSRDFAPIGLSAGMPVAIFVRNNLPVKTLDEFIRHARASAGRLTMAHGGAGSVGFSTCQLFISMLGIQVTPVPYNGARPAMNALAARQIDFGCDQVANGIDEVRRGTVQALAVASAVRTPVLPAVPTTREAGLTDFEVVAWNALFAPKGTPQAILDRLSEALDGALSDESTRRRLGQLGCEVPEPRRRGQQALARFVDSEISRWQLAVAPVFAAQSDAQAERW